MLSALHQEIHVDIGKSDYEWLLPGYYGLRSTVSNLELYYIAQDIA